MFLTLLLRYVVVIFFSLKCANSRLVSAETIHGNTVYLNWFFEQQARFENLKKAQFVEFCVFIICPRYEYFEFEFTNTYLQCQLQTSDDTAFGAGTFSWKNPLHFWKAGSGEVMTVENLYYLSILQSWV